MTEAEAKGPHTVSKEVVIDIQSLDKWYGDFQVLHGVDFQVHKGERVVICGPSGSGQVNAYSMHQRA